MQLLICRATVSQALVGEARVVDRGKWGHHTVLAAQVLPSARGLDVPSLQQMRNRGQR